MAKILKCELKFIDQIKGTLKHQQSYQREKWGCAIVVNGDVNVGLIKVTLKQNEQMEDVAGMQTEVERCLVGDV